MTLDELARDPAKAEQLTDAARAAVVAKCAAILAAVAAPMMTTAAPPTPAPSDDLLDVEQVAARLKLSKPYVYEMIRSRQLPAVRLGRGVRVRPADLAAFVRDRA